MSNFQHKVLRLFTGPNTNADWHIRPNGYSKDEVALIQDPSFGSRKEITSIPSPFARVHLFENAFEWVANRAKIDGKQALAGKTAYHQLVSDSLDIAEVFFNFEVFNQTHKNLRFVVWNKKKELDALTAESAPKGHKLFGETLKLYLDQDNTKTRFDLVENFYLLYCDDTLLGGTSPSTLFFAAHNEGFRLAKVRLGRGNDTFFDAEPYPLYKRSLPFQRYLYGLFTLHPELKRTMAPLWRYMETCRDVLKEERPDDGSAIQAIIESRNFSRDTFNAEFVPATTEDENTFIDVVKDIHHRRMRSSALDYSNDAFAIKADKYTKGRRPLVLQNKFSKALSYCGGKWKPDTEVPYFDAQQDLEKRVLPGETEVYPYLTVSDFLEPYIMRVPYPVDKEYFYTGKLDGFRESDRSIGSEGVPGDDAYLLPLTPLFFEFFDPEYLDRVAGGKHNIRLIKTGSDAVEVQLQIPIQSGDFILFKRIYRPNQSADSAKNEGAVIPCRFDLGFFPLFFVRTSEGTEEVNQIVVSADNDIALANKHFDYNLDFYRNNGQIIQPKGKVTRQDKHKHQNSVTTKYYQMEDYYDFVQVSNGENKAIIVPRWKEKQAGTNPVTVAIDFGTTNTFMAFDFGEGMETLEIKENERFLATLSEYWVTIRMIKEPILITLAPYTLGPNEECRLPQRTITSEIKGVNYTKSIPGTDISIPFFFEKRALLNNEEWATNLKWAKMSETEGNKNNTRTETFLSVMLFMARNQIIARGGDLKNCKLVWMYPTSMGETARNIFGKAWKTIAEKYLGPTVKVEKVLEALAPYYAFSANERKSGQHPVINVDIGGGTTDVIIFKDNHPMYATSFRFAGNAIFGNGYADAYDQTNGLVRLFEKMFSDWLTENLQSVPQLHKAYTEGVKKMGSADINSFFLSVENNHEVKNSKIRPWSYSALLQEREDIKVAFLVFYAAIIYHLANLMKQLGLTLPRQIAFSGRGAGIIFLLDSDPDLKCPNAADLARKIFERVYNQKYYQEGLDLLLGSSPKEKTCYGALNMVKQRKMSVSFKNAVLMNIEKGEVLVDNKEINTDKELRYVDMNDPEVLSEIIKEVQIFLDFFFDLSRDISFSNKFGALTGERLIRLKPVLTGDLMNNLKAGLDARYDSGVDPSEHVSEPLFFYPLIGSIYQLLNHFANEANK